MARKYLQGKLSGEELSLHQVWMGYEFQGFLIGEETARTLDSFHTGAPLVQHVYFGKTREELVEFFGEQRRELRISAMLGLLAATEAALRVDFIVRVMNKKKDVVSRSFTDLYKTFGLRVGLEEQILGVWREHSPRETSEAIGQFKGTLILRHWIAHGRYWKPKLGQDYDPVDIFEICDSLLKATVS